MNELIETTNRLLTIIDSGSMTSTAKLTTLLGILDLIPQMPEDSFELSIDDLAEKVLELSWNHTAPFHEGEPLRQLAVRNRENLVVLTEVNRLQSLSPRATTLYGLKETISNAEWKKSLTRVKSQLKKNPLSKLQNLGGASTEIIYRNEFTDNKLHFLPVGLEALKIMGPSLRRLVESRFIQYVARLNMGEAEYSLIENYLFGVERFMPTTEFRKDLAEIQDGKCVYTGVRLSKSAESNSLDHFIPWNRVRISTVQNLMLTTKSFNSRKSDLIPALDLIEKWAKFQTENKEAIRELAHRHSWPYQPGVTSHALTWLYQTTPVGSIVFGQIGRTKTTPETLTATNPLLQTQTI